MRRWDTRTVLRLIPLTVVAAIALAAPAGAVTIHAPEDYAIEQTLRAWVDEAALHVPTPDRAIRVRLRRCSKPHSMGGACVHYGRWGQIIDFPRELMQLAAADDIAPGVSLQVRLAFLHEVGHAADLQARPVRPWRAAFRGIFQLRPTLKPERTIGFRGIDPWLLAYTPDDAVRRPMEWFADAYAFCAVWPHGPPGAEALSGYDYAPTSEQHARACRVVRAMRLG